MQKKVILLGLNEINFDFIEAYIAKGYLPNFKTLFEKNGYIQTTSENEYKLLEPWIQWVTIHTGKTYAEHKIFRLGDIIGRNDLEQLWEIAEKKSLSVAAVSPFNAENRLKKSSFFVSDPWTNTTPSGSSLLKKLSRTVSSAVNENANNSVGMGAAVTLLRSLMSFVPARKYFKYLKLVSTVFSQKGMKAVFLDVFLGDAFLTLWKKHTPDFSSLFLNAGAHIQHHYMFNSKVYEGNIKNPDWYCPQNQDPLLNVLKYYDIFLGELLNLDARIFIATGLHQNPHEHLTYYWRLKKHDEFLKTIGLDFFKEAMPRMSRDFLITFNNEQDAIKGAHILESITATNDNAPIFEVDNRGDSLFVELVYDKEIKDGFKISVGETKSTMNFFNMISFVAIKNGEHDGIGYFIDTQIQQNKSTIIPLKDTFSKVVSSFN